MSVAPAPGGLLLTEGPPPRWFWPGCLVAGAALGTLILLVTSGGPAESAALLLLGLAAPVLAVVDWREHRLPDVVTLPLAVGVLVLLAVQTALDRDPGRGGTALLIGLGAVAFFFALHLLAPGSMGFGDVKLMLSLGVLLGWHGVLPTAAGVLLGLLSALVFGVIAILLRRADRRSHVALGPHLLIGALLVLLVAA